MTSYLCHDISATDDSNLTSETDACFDLIIKIVRMKGAVEQLVNSVSALIGRAVRQLCTQANKETKFPALPLDASCRSFLFGRNVVMPVFKCASVLSVPSSVLLPSFILIARFPSRNPPLSTAYTRAFLLLTCTTHIYTCIPAPYMHTARCTPHTAHRTLHTAHCTLHTGYRSLVFI
jgi:hypothetical protein